jgi:glycosyltransferase involved in cell wall biosynthesis
MKVLLVHLSDGHKGGGGGIAMLRLHLALRRAGVDARVLCRTKTSESPYVTEIPRRPRIEAMLKKVTDRLGLNDIHLVGSYRVKKEEAYRQADIIDFQGIHTRTLSYLALPSLTKQKPGVFTMHDMWALTGHCAYSYDCERWRIGCGNCPYLAIHPSVRRDNTRIEWKLKRWVFSRSNLVFVSPSKWLYDLAREGLLAPFPCYFIPNGVDTDTFRPLSSEICRRELGLPLNRKVLMFSALKLDLRRKGGDLLLESLETLPQSVKSETVLLTIGEGGEGIDERIGMEVHNLGYVEDDHRKAVAYSASDLFLFPTRADNNPLVLLESMACGTPMVSFRVGGVPELVRPEVTGYLAEAGNVAGFRDGIVQLLQDDRLRSGMREECRNLAVREYRHDQQVRRYRELYEDLVRNGIGEKSVGAVGSPV